MWHPRDKHAVFVRIVLRANHDDTSEVVVAARRHVAGCEVCEQRVKRGWQLIQNIVEHETKEQQDRIIRDPYEGWRAL